MLPLPAPREAGTGTALMGTSRHSGRAHNPGCGIPVETSVDRERRWDAMGVGEVVERRISGWGPQTPSTRKRERVA